MKDFVEKVKKDYKKKDPKLKPGAFELLRYIGPGLLVTGRCIRRDVIA